MLLQQGEFTATLKILRERETRTPASPLFRQEAEALMGQSLFKEALEAAARGVASAQEVGDTETIFENAHVAARACEALGDKDGARKWLNQATEAAIRLGQAGSCCAPRRSDPGSRASSAPRSSKFYRHCFRRRVDC